MGPLEVSVGDRPVALGGARQLKLFAFLVLHANRAVSADALIDAVWGHDREGAVKRLQMAITRLRKALEPLEAKDGSVLRTVSGGYLLSIAPGELDADVFEHRVRDGRLALEEADPARSTELLGEALALWRGPPLAEVAFEDFAQAEIRRLEELHLLALETRIESDLELGRHTELIGELEALLGKEPTRERLAGHLMTALYRSGRQADALEVYQHTRTQLAEQLGLEPGPALKSLQAQILAQAPALQGVVETRLPARGPRVLGRDRELEELDALLTDPAIALVTLTGPGGSGKTTLALEAARRAEASFTDGATPVWLAELCDPSQVLIELARALKIDVTSHEPAIQTLVRVLRVQQRLLVVDNFEHVMAAAPMLAQLARECPRLTLLVTSRAPLHVSLERVYRVDGLAAPTSLHELSAVSLAEWPASALFIERSRVATPEYELDDHDALAVAELCNYLGGLPLAVELAAASTGVLSPGEILQRLRGSAPPLSPPRRDVPERQRTIRATIDWSVGLLTDAERKLFGRLSLFAGGFTIDAAEAVSEDIDCSTVEGLTTLLDHGLIYRRRTGSIVRLALLEPIRDYARERLGTDPACHAATHRHAQHYAGLAEAVAAELLSGDPTQRLERLDQERPNFRAALDRADAQPALDTALRIASALGHYVFVRGLIAEYRPWLAWALDQPPGDPRIRARALFDLGWLADEDGQYEQATTALEECLALCTQLENVSLAAQCEAHIACNARYRGHLEQSARYATRALRTAAQVADPRTEAIVLLLTGYCAPTYEDARRKCQRALALFQSLGDRIWPPKIKANLAKQARRAGDHSFARQLISESIADAAPVWGAGLQAQNERELGLIELSNNRYAEARTHLSRSLALCRSIGDRHDIREVLVGLAALETGEGADERAATLLSAARTLLDSPLDVRGLLEGCAVSARHLATLTHIAAATTSRPLAPLQLDAILGDASAGHAFKGHCLTQRRP